LKTSTTNNFIELEAAKKIIVHIVPSLNKGGAERFVTDICNELSQNIVAEIYLVSLFDNNRNTSFVLEIDTRVQYISFSKRAGFDVLVLYKLTKWLLDIRPQVVHTHINAFEYVSLFKMMYTKSLYFHTIHSKAEKECPNKFIKFIRRFFYLRDTLPITISRDGLETFKSYYELSNVVIVENGRPQIQKTAAYLDLHAKYRNNRNNFLLVHLGRIIDVKNQQLLIESVKIFNHKSYKKCLLLIIGGVRDEQLYNHLLAISDNDVNVQFLGDKNNVADYLSIADAFCLSSHYEGMPMSIIEAFSVGCVPISTPVGGIPEMISDGITGFLSKDLTAESYCHAIERCLTAVDLDTIRINCINEYNNQYSIQTCAAKHWKLYQNRFA
jgi:glycosyltransferase involved in cell wall biosynthesis